MDDIESVIGPIYFIRTDGDNIFIRKFQLRKSQEDYYDFEFSDIEGIKMRSLEEIKNSKISLMPEPNINLIFNPEYGAEALEQAKTLIKTLEQQ